MQTFRLGAPVWYGPAGHFLVNSVAIGDVTGDRLPDIVVVTEGATINVPETDRNQIIVWPQTVAHTLGEPIKARYMEERVSRPTGLVLGDLDGDNIPEIVISHETGLSIAKYDGQTRRLSLSRIAASPGHDSSAVLDFDSDGKADIVSQSFNSGATIYKGDGKGAFVRYGMLSTPLSGYNTLIASSLVAGGRRHLLMTNNQGWPYWWVMKNTGSGFSQQIAYGLPKRSTDNYPWMGSGLGVGDLNGDGLSDVAVSLHSNRPAGIGIFTQTVSGDFILDRVLDSFDLPEPVGIADLDGNGLKDIVTVHGGWSYLGYYLNSSDGFKDEQRISIIPQLHDPTSAYRPDGLAVGDVNSDGCLDVAVADYKFGLTLLMGEGCKRP